MLETNESYRVAWAAAAVWGIDNVHKSAIITAVDGNGVTFTAAGTAPIVKTWTDMGIQAPE